MKIELIADSLTFIEKANARIAMFKGPPPMPRKDATVPKIKPTRKILSTFLSLYVRTLSYV
ncbi:hypothetical protein ACI2OX_20695 [Bacillus sp. N9]